MKNDEKRRIENAYFICFAESVGLNIDLNSIEQPDPPEPDIKVCVDGIGQMAFELTDLRPQAARETETLAFKKVPRWMRNYYEQLSPECRKTFDEKYEGAWITLTLLPFSFSGKGFKFSEFTTIPKIFEFLKNQPVDYFRNPNSLSSFQYPCAKEETKALYKEIKTLGGVHVSKPYPGKPSEFKVIYAGSNKLKPDENEINFNKPSKDAPKEINPDEMNKDALKKKLSKKYRIEKNIELHLILTARESIYHAKLMSSRKSPTPALRHHLSVGSGFMRNKCRNKGSVETRHGGRKQLCSPGCH